MKIAHLSLSLLITACACVSNAGTLDLYANANAGEFDTAGVSIIASSSKTNVGHYSGLGNFGPISALATVNDPSTGAFAVSTNQTVSANITSETSGSVTFSEGWTSNFVNHQGYANVYGSLPGSSQIQAYTFTTSAPSFLDVNFNSTFTSSGSSTPGFGLWNPLLFVDGVAYYPVDPKLGWVTPLAKGGWQVALGAAGTHTIGFEGFSNVSGGLATESMQLNETLNFSTSPTPEPASISALCIGGLAFLRRRKSRAL